MKTFLLAVTLAVLGLCSPARAQNGMLQIPPTLLSPLGYPLAGVNVSVCGQLSTSAASVTNNIATYTVSSTTGFSAGQTLFVSGFTGGDTYLNVSGTITALTSTTLSIALTHANASAATNGSLYAEGNSTTPCAPLSSLFTDNTGGTAASNPFTSDGLGNLAGFVAPGYYEIQTYGSTITTTLYKTGIGCVPSATAGSCGVTLSGNNAWTGTETHSGSETFSGTTTIASPVINGTPSGTGIATVTRKKGTGNGSDYTTGNTSMTDVDGTNLSYTVTVNTGWQLACVASGTATNDTANDGTDVQLFDTQGSVTIQRSATSQVAAGGNLKVGWAVNGTIAGDGLSHTVKLQFQAVSGGTAHLINATNGNMPQFTCTLEPSN